MNSSSLPLESHPNTLLSQRHPRRTLLRRNSPIFSLILHKRNILPARHRSHLSEAWKAIEDDGERLFAVVFGNVPEEEGLVRWEVFVRHDAGGCGGRLLDRTFGEGGVGGPFSGWLLVLGFDGLFALCISC